MSVGGLDMAEEHKFKLFGEFAAGGARSLDIVPKQRVEKFDGILDGDAGSLGTVRKESLAQSNAIPMP